MVRSVHELLKTRFNLTDGLADPSVTLLDPAAGTMTFPAEAIKLAVQEYVQKYGEGGKKEFIRNQILRNFYAFELMMAPYAIGHMKISFLLDSLGYQLRQDERFNLYLTNTLEMDEIEQIAIPGVSSLSEESHLAGQVKNQESILVIMGNPPYSGVSSNINTWTEKLLKEDLDGAQSYYKVDEEPLGEQNPKMLQDDYVKFLRFAQWKIQRSGKGIVAMITNHSYLENLTFRGMRQSLMKTFDEIFVFDLHGNSLKKETTPDGRKDENVFDIRVGVVISLFIKNDKKKKFSQVFHGQLFGDRETKYSHLSNNHIGTVSWDSIHPSTKFYIFNPRDSSNEAKYYQFPAVTEIFQEFSTGITTGRDAFAFDFDKNILSRRIEQFRDISFSDEMISVTYKLSNTSSWNLSNSRKATMKLADWQQNILICDFRPFDKRFLYYDSNLVDRTRHEIMRHMLSENLGLVTVRQVAEGIFNHCIITDTIVNSRMTLSSRGRGYLFPLYLYSDKEKVDLFSFDEPEKVTNFSKEFKELLTVNYAQIPTPEVVIAYMYSILYSNIYRRIYATYLKSDFPRIPFTSDLQVFNEIAKLGQRLINLHLLKSPELDHPSR